MTLAFIILTDKSNIK